MTQEPGAQVITVASAVHVRRPMLASFGGLVIGVVVALGLAYVRARIKSPLSDVTLSLLAPFAAYLPAHAVHASGLVAAVVVGLYLGVIP